jgi:hypothetical protein
MNCVLDDSGGYSQTEFICIAGYLATDEQWQTFSDELRLGDSTCRIPTPGAGATRNLSLLWGDPWPTSR